MKTTIRITDAPKATRGDIRRRRGAIDRGLLSGGVRITLGAR